MCPEAAAKTIVRIARKRRLKPSYAIGITYKGAVLLNRLLPQRIVSRIVGRIYAK